jgi:hypothetical protein
MGSRNGPYNYDFLKGSKVRVKERAFLESFRQNWNYHDPLQLQQLDFAGKESVVICLGIYFGGDELYLLADIPGIWHEQCLEPA